MAKAVAKAVAARTSSGIRPADRAMTDEAGQTAGQPLAGDPATVHPDLAEKLPEYQEVRDCRKGATAVKDRGEEYLPKPTGFKAQKDDGVAMYRAYIKRAQFPDLLSPTIGGMVGIVHRREAQIEGMDEGTPMAVLWERATPDGLPLETLHRRITEELLTVGRCELLPDAPIDGGEAPYIALYSAESMINWSEDRDFFVFEEEYRIRNGYEWTSDKRYRVLTLEEGKYVVRVVDKDGSPVDPKFAEGVFPSKSGGGNLEEIPVVVIGSRDLGLEPDEIPLLGVARSALAIYRLDADYRHQLFMTGQETLVFSGMRAEDIPNYVGAGVAVALEAPEAQASYVGPKGVGISAHKTAIDDERENAAAAGARVFDTQKRGAESGDALRIRSRASTATLVSVALASAAGLEKALRHCAVMMGQDPEQIVVTPNLDFVDSKLTPAEAKALVDVWMTGAISYETLYENLQKGEVASQERTAEEEQELRAEEDAALIDEESEAALGGDDETGEVGDDELEALFSPETLVGAE